MNIKNINDECPDADCADTDDNNSSDKVVDDGFAHNLNAGFLVGLLVLS